MNAGANAVFLEAIGFAAPGMPTWQSARAVLRGEAAYEYAPLAPHTPTMLPVNERRRATPAVRLAFQAAEDAIQGTTLPASGFASVFASSDADLAIIHRLCTALSSSPRLVSPTDFHNSVHNAAAGYWHIAATAKTASSSISAYDHSFAAGLFEACLQVRVDGHDTMLVAFDLPAPAPLHACRPITHPAGVALLLTRLATQRTLAALTCELAGETEDHMADPALETLRLGNPSARALPLLRQVACGATGRVVLAGANDRHLTLELAVP